MSDLVMPVIVVLPPEIDVTNASDVLDLIAAACAPGVPVVIADLTATSFCDSSGLQHLIQASLQAAASGTELRLAISPGRSSQPDFRTDRHQAAPARLPFNPVGAENGVPAAAPVFAAVRRST